MAGWIKQWEVPDGHWLNEDLRYIGAWYGLIQMAEPKNKKIVRFGNMIEAKRGSVYTSISELAKKWNVSRWWVRHFLEMLEADEMIDRQQTDTRLTTIIVRNYAKYQDKPNNRPTPERQVIEQDIVQQTDRSFASRPTAEATSFLTNAEGIEGIEGIEGESRTTTKRPTRFVPPTLSEVLQFISEERLPVDGRKFWNNYEATGWYMGLTKMKDWKAAVRKWAAENEQDRKQRAAPDPKRFNNFEPRQGESAYDAYIRQLEETEGGDP